MLKPLMIFTFSGLFSRQKRIAVAVGILVLVLVIFLIVWHVFYKEPPITLPSEPCLEDWLYFKRKCYYLSEEEKDWDSSQRFCSLYEASLAVIENHQEMHFLTKRMHMQDSWIGLRKREEGFYWINGTPLTTDLFHIQDHEECAYTDSSSISTSACSLPRHWICSRHPFK
ncbi:C-type lectin domain family 2 member L-like isoform 1-T2 [Macrochelys suwanniensis]